MKVNNSIHTSYVNVFIDFVSEKTSNGGKNFETVKHGSRTLTSLADRRPELDLENKFDALRRS